MDFFGTDFTLELTGTTIILGVLLLLALSVAIFLYVSSLLKKIKKYQSPKYGFLGKPIYPVVVVSLLVGGLFYLNFGVSDQPVVNIQASKTIDAQIVTLIGNSVNGERNVEFSVVPSVNDEQWGDAEDMFDFFWTVTGPENFDRFEFSKSGLQPSSFNENLVPGDYQIRVVVIYDDTSYEFTDILSF